MCPATVINFGQFPRFKGEVCLRRSFYHRNARVCFLYPASLPYSGISTGVSFGFNKGYLLSNEQGLLDMGTRKEVAYIALQHEKDINEAAFLEILHEAVLIDSEMSSGKKKKAVVESLSNRQLLHYN